MLRRSAAVNREERDPEDRFTETNRHWIRDLSKFCREHGGLEQLTKFFLWRGGDCDKKFSSYKMAEAAFIELYKDCDVFVLPTMKAIKVGGEPKYMPPELMELPKLTKYGKALRTAVEPFREVTESEAAKWADFCDLHEDLFADVRREILIMLFSWENMVMKAPLPDDIESQALKSPAVEILVGRRGSKTPIDTPRASRSARKPHVTVNGMSPDEAVVVKVTNSTPPGFVRAVYENIPPGEGLPNLLARGCYRKTFPVCLTTEVTRKGKDVCNYPGVGPAYSNMYGRVFAVMTTLSWADRPPAWKLDPSSETKALIAAIVTGTQTRHEMRGQLGERHIYCLEVTETTYPYVVHRVLLQELEKAVQVQSKKQAFAVNLKDPEKTWFQLMSDPNGNWYDLLLSKEWPAFAVRRQSGGSSALVPAQRSITPENSDSEDEDEDKAEAYRKEDVDSWLSKVRSPLGRLDQNNKDLDDPLVRILTTLGAEKNHLVIQTKSDHLRELSRFVRNAAAHISTDGPPPKQAELTALGVDGGAQVNPLGGVGYTGDTPDKLRQQHATQVGVLTDKDACSRSKMLCLKCNGPVFARYFESFSSGDLRRLLAPGQGGLEFVPELISQLKFEENQSVLFCSTCPPGDDESSPVLLCPGPDSVIPCPRTLCAHLILTGDRQIGLRCPSCALMFDRNIGSIGVKVKDLNLDPEGTKTTASQRLAQILAYMYDTGGKPFKERLRNPEALRKVLAQAAISHASVPGLPRCRISTRIVAFFVDQLFAENGKGGLCLEDFQQVCGEIPDQTGHWQDVLTAATGKLSKGDEHAPTWGFDNYASDDVKAAVVLAAAKNCYECYAFFYGPNYKEDMKQAMVAYNHTVYEAGNESAFPIVRKLALLTAIFLDYSSRLHKQADNWNKDQRFHHEKISQPGCKNNLRLMLYLNSVWVLKKVYAPMKSAREAWLSEKAFTTQLNCTDSKAVIGLKAKGNPEAEVKQAEAEKKEVTLSAADKMALPKPLSKVGAGSTSAASKELEDLKKQLQVANDKLASQKKADDERKAKAKAVEKAKKDEKKAAAGTAEKPVQDLKSGGIAERTAEEATQIITIKTGVFYSQYVHTQSESPCQVAQQCPRNVAGKTICPAFNTIKGCCRPKEVPCPLAHELIPVGCFDLAIQLFLLTNGGHKSFEGKLSSQAMMSLLDADQQERLAALTEAMQVNTLHTILHDKLTTMQLPVGEHVSLKAVNEGNGVQWLQVWGSEAPFSFSLNGVRVLAAFCVRLGKSLQNGMKMVLSGHVFDVGEKVALPAGGCVGNACFVMSLAASLAVQRKWPHISGMQPEYLLLRDLVKQWASIPLEKLLQFPNSKFTSMFIAISKFEEEGLPDSFLMMVDAEKTQSLQRVHVAIISQSATDAAEFTIRLVLEGSSKLRKQFFGNRDTAELLADWTIEGQRKALFHSFPVVCIASLMVGDTGDRHAHPFSIRYTLKEFFQFMRRAHLAGAVKIVVEKCGMVKHLQAELDTTYPSEDSIRSAHAAMYQLHERVSQGAPLNLDELMLSKTGRRKADRVKQQQRVSFEAEVSHMHEAEGVAMDSLAGSKISLHEGLGVVEKKSSAEQVQDGVEVQVVKEGQKVFEAEEVFDCPRCKKLWVSDDGSDANSSCKDCRWVSTVVSDGKDVRVPRQLQEHSPLEKAVTKAEKYDKYLSNLTTARAGFRQLNSNLNTPKSDTQTHFLPPMEDMTSQEWRDNMGCETRLGGRLPKEVSEDLRREKLRSNLDDWRKAKRAIMFVDTQQWASYYDAKFVQLLVSPNEFSEEERLKVLQQLGKFMNEWHYFEVERLSGDSEPTHAQLRMALLSIADGLRRVWFKERLNAGPDWASIYGEFKGKVSGEHLEHLRHLVEEGGDALYMGPVKGYKAEAAKQLSTEEEGVVLKEFAKLLFAKKAIVFDYSDPLIEKRLVASGVRMGSTVVAEKKTAAGIPTGEFRVCNDSTDKEHAYAANSGINSQAHSHQKTTNPAGVVLAAIGEQREHKDAHLRGGKVDIAEAFLRIPQPLGLIGCFASHLPGAMLVFVNLVLVFGSKASPGLFEVMGDLIIKALNMTPKANPKFSGDLPPRSRRFVDDIFYSVAMSGSRYKEHQASILRLLRAMLGEDAVNLEKQGREGDAENYKYAFGCGIDYQRRRVWAPGAKLKKAYNLCQKFLNKEEPHLTVGEVQKLSGVLQSVIGFAVPAFKKVVFPRLHAIISNATMASPGLDKLPQSMVAAPCLRDEVDEHLAWEQLRCNLRLFFGLASINNGALMSTTFEGCLPLQQRLTFPGNETEEQHISFISDASGKSIFIQNMKNGEFILEKLTEDELKAFNSWDTQDKTVQVTINHLENLPCLWAAVMFWGSYPGCIIRQFLDNVAAEYLQLNGKIKSAKDEQVGAIIAIIELLFQIRGYGDRVASKDNIADYFTRENLDMDAEEYLRDFERRTGLKPKKVELPEWLRDMQWVAGAEAGSKAWYGISLKVLEHLEEKFSEELSRYCKVPLAMVKEQFERALKDIPPDPIPEFVQDFPSIEGPSKERQFLTEPPRPTLTTLRRQAEKQGESNWRQKRGQSSDISLHEAIVAELNLKFQEDRKVLERPNPFYDPEYEAPLPSALKWLPGRLASMAKFPIRLGQNIGLYDFFTGQGAFCKALKDLTNQSPLLVVDHDLAAREHLRDQFPEAMVQSSMHEATKSLKWAAGRVGICTFSLPCIPFVARQKSKGMEDDLFAPNLENVIRVINTVQPLGFLLECAPGICRAHGPSGSAVDAMKAQLSKYHILVSTVKVEELVSRLSGFQGSIAKESTLVRGYLKAFFEQEPEDSFGQAKQAKLGCSTMALDLGGKETFAYSVMPPADQVDFVFEFEVKDNGTARVGNIHSPLKSNQAGFPNDAFCPRLGIIPAVTSSGRGPWIQVSCPSLRSGYEKQWDPGFRRLTAREVARAIGMRGFDTKKWNTFLGTNGEDAWRMVGNMPAQSFFDEAVTAMLLILFQIPEGEENTVFETWRSGSESKGDSQLKAKGKQRAEEQERRGGLAGAGASKSVAQMSRIIDKKFVPRTRALPQLSPEDIIRIDAFAEVIRTTGKKANTIKNYYSDQEHWKQYFMARSWDPLMKHDDYAEKCKKVISYIAYERVTWKLLGRSIKRKLSGIGWFFIKNFQRNPFQDLEAVQVFLRDLSSKDPPPDPKIPVTPQLLELLCALIDQTSVGGAAIAACVDLGFWKMMRSTEYLAPDNGEIDPERVITWGDITMKRSLSPNEEECGDDEFQEGRVMTTRIISYKNEKVVATRTIEQNDKSPTCPVKAIKWLHQVLKEKKIARHANRPVCQLEGKGKFITRAHVADLLKVVAAKCGCNPKKFGSHSLRRGGASAYAAAGVPDEDIKRFGRWMSDSYKLYVMLNDSSILSKGHMNPAFVVPRYEKN